LANLTLPEARCVGEDVILQCTLNDVAKKIFPNWEIALRAQKAYIQKYVFMGTQNPEILKDQLLEMNDAPEYFPTWADPAPVTVPPCKLEEDELVDVMNGSKKFEWHLVKLAQGCYPELFASVIEYCTTSNSMKLTSLS